MTIGGEAAFVADADAVLVEPFCMCSLLIERTTGVHHAVTSDVEMIADIGKAAGQMVATAIFQRIVAVAACGTAMNHYQIDEPVVLILTTREDGHAHRVLPPIHACVPNEVAMAVRMVITMRSTVAQMLSFCSIE